MVGVGAVGLSLGARLVRAGADVRFVVRRPEAARALAREGIEVWDPRDDHRFRVPATAVVGCAAAAIGRDPALLCVRSPDTEAAARALAAAAPDAPAVCLQNDVDNEATAARSLPRVVGAVYRQTCTRTGDTRVTALGAGRMVLGLWPEGRDLLVERLAGLARRAGFDVGVSARIAEDKWLKLCVNLMSAVNALVVRDDHETEAFVEVKARVLEEARAVLGAAGIAARSCDGRDRSLDEEIRWQRESLRRGASARRLPVYNQVWQSLARDLPLESGRYHRRMLDLAARHGVPTPANARVLEVLEETSRSGRGPESVRAAALLPT